MAFENIDNIDLTGNVAEIERRANRYKTVHSGKWVDSPKSDAELVIKLQNQKEMAQQQGKELRASNIRHIMNFLERRNSPAGQIPIGANNGGRKTRKGKKSKRKTHKRK